MKGIRPAVPAPQSGHLARAAPTSLRKNLKLAEPGRAETAAGRPRPGPPTLNTAVRELLLPPNRSEA
eukprot:555359-Hanusia_phi.AAC.1